VTNEEAKQILSAYRPGGADASDPVFERALEQAKRDPELAAWFKQERESDADLARVFQSIPVPEAAKRSLLTLARVKPEGKRTFFWGWTTAVAAGVALVLGITMLLMPYLRPAPEVTLQQPDSIGVVELAGLARAAMPLDFRGESVPELRAWLAGRGAPAPGTLSEALTSLSAVGCRVFSDEHGNAISLLCLKKDGQLVHLFVVEGDARRALAMAEKEWISQDGWTAYCWSDEDRAYVLLSPAPPGELEELVI
jgi:hypothetical protein